jgi:preprotein translocase subunit SecE
MIEKIVSYIKEAYAELQKVIFPTKEQVINAYIAVVVVVSVVTLFLALVDATMSFVISTIID